MHIRTYKIVICILAAIMCTTYTHAQFKRCGITEGYIALFEKDLAFKTQFYTNQQHIIPSRQLLNARNTPLQATIPVVVHVVLNDVNQAKITDAVIQKQINFLTTCFQGLNADTSRIPLFFKSRFAKGKLVFTLAKTDPEGNPTNGIVRVVRDNSFSLTTVDNAKQTETGGSTGWDATKYYNIWVTFFIDNLLGISVFPGDPRPLNLHGTVVDYRVFGIKEQYQLPRYNNGKTLVHETGHFFNLIHIWGDDNGRCDGTDFANAPPEQDDTPNQTKETNGNPDIAGTGKVIKTDMCSPNKDTGIMYQNYMDYTDDVALVMFTNGQFDRMEAALSTSPDRRLLLQSTTYLPPPPFVIDAAKGYSITPNPFNNTVTIRLQQPTVPLQRVEFVSTDGQIVQRAFYESGTTQSILNFNLPSISKGVYIVVLKFSDGRKVSEKIIKQ